MLTKKPSKNRHPRLTAPQSLPYTPIRDFVAAMKSRKAHALPLMMSNDTLLTSNVRALVQGAKEYFLLTEGEIIHHGLVVRNTGENAQLQVSISDNSFNFLPRRDRSSAPAAHGLSRSRCANRSDTMLGGTRSSELGDVETTKRIKFSFAMSWHTNSCIRTQQRLLIWS